VLAKASEIKKPALRATLETNRPLAELSRKLVSLREDVPLNVDLDALEPGAPDVPTLRRLFTELELDRPLTELDRRYGGAPARKGEVAIPRAPKPEALPPIVATLISTQSQLESALKDAMASAALSMETLLDGDDPRRSPLVGITLAWRE